MKKSEFKLDPPVAPEPTPDSEAFPHPGLWVRSMLDDAGYSIPRAAKLMGVNRANLNEVCRGNTAISRDLAYRLDALLNEDGEPDDLAKLIIGTQAGFDWENEAPTRSAFRSFVLNMKAIEAARNTKAEKGAADNEAV